MRRKFRFQLAMTYIMAQMGEKHPFGPNFRSKGGRFTHTEVSGMGSIAQTPQHQGIDSLKVWQAFRGDATAVCGIDERSYAECEDEFASMAYRNGLDFKPCNEDLLIRFQPVWLEVGNPSPLPRVLQHITETGGNGGDDLLRTEDREGALLAEYTQVINTIEMVSVVMGIENGIEALQVCPQSLQAKLRSGVDKQ